jgi:ABC-type Zn uptake system ZnuABC Zn-binding protein ZnuA
MQLQDVARNVGGDRAVVIGILKLGMDAHDHELTMEDVVNIANADAIIVHGAGYDTWMEKMIRGAYVAAPVITATEGLTPPRSDELHGESPSEQGGEAAISFKTMLYNATSSRTPSKSRRHARI